MEGLNYISRWFLLAYISHLEVFSAKGNLQDFSSSITLEKSCRLNLSEVCPIHTFSILGLERPSGNWLQAKHKSMKTVLQVFG